MALVLSFGTESIGAATLLPLVSFFFGFFPGRALAMIERLVIAAVKLTPAREFEAMPLSALKGMSYAHELRLQREGYENSENLSYADPVDLAVRTGLGYQQLREWVSEAWLIAHLREDYAAFVKTTGIISRAELEHYFECSQDTTGAIASLPGDDAEGQTKGWRAKIAVLHVLTQSPHHPSVPLARC